MTNVCGNRRPPPGVQPGVSQNVPPKESGTHAKAWVPGEPAEHHLAKPELLG